MRCLTWIMLWLLASCGANDSTTDAAPSAVDAQQALPDADRARDASGSPDGAAGYACCSIDGATCTDVADERACTDIDGYSFWPSMTCATHTCTNEIQGACCVDQGDGTFECTDDTTVDGCFGVHAGADTVCRETNCARLAE